MRLLCVFAIAVACGFSATAANAGTIIDDSRINQLASDIAGVHMNVWCYTDYEVWRREWDVDEGRTTFGAASGGRNQFFVAVAPAVCTTLQAAFDNGPTAAGTRWGALAILTLVHVSLYQGNVERGLTHGWRYEGVGSCAALKVLPQWVGRLGFTPQISSEAWEPMKRRGKIIRWRRVVKKIPNPAYAQVLDYAASWHRYLFGADCL
jgi:hypothetical protein